MNHPLSIKMVAETIKMVAEKAPIPSEVTTHIMNMMEAHSMKEQES